MKPGMTFIVRRCFKVEISKIPVTSLFFMERFE